MPSSYLAAPSLVRHLQTLSLIISTISYTSNSVASVPESASALGQPAQSGHAQSPRANDAKSCQVD